MTCEDCIHYNICSIWSTTDLIKDEAYKFCYGMFKPAADVVEVVRCKDCKYLYCLDAIDRRFYCRHTPKGLSGINIIEDNPYCSYGERKEV